MGGRIRILLMVPHLGGGGAERVMARVAAGLTGESLDVHLAVMTDDEPGAEPLPERVTLHRLECGRVRWAAWKMVRLIGRLRPDVVVSGMMHLSAAVLALRPLLPRGTRLVARVNTTVSRSIGGGVERRVYGWLMRGADGVICQTEAMAEDLSAHLGVSRSRIAVVANPVDMTGIRAEADRARGDRTRAQDEVQVLCAGRLSAEKGVDLLLEAWRILGDRLRQTGMECRLTILGEGAERARLEAMAARLGIAASVSFRGFVQDVSSWLGWADVYVQPSRYEGMPNALLEAAAAGVAVVTTPSSEGVVRLLRGEDGAWVAREIAADALAEAMAAAMSEVRRRRAANSDVFAHAWMGAFAQETALRQWEQCLREMCAERAR